MKPVRYPDDCLHIRLIANSLGYDCTLRQAEELWEKYSDDFGAGWLVIDDNNYQIIDAVKDYFGE